MVHIYIYIYIGSCHILIYWRVHKALCGIYKYIYILVPTIYSYTGEYTEDFTDST